jgi:hypothetical protein
VNYAVQTQNASLTSGTLTFQPGETVKKISAPTAGLPSGTLVRVVLSDPVGAEVTTVAQLLVIPDGSGGNTNTTLVPFNAEWKFLDTGVDQGTAWRASGFSDTSWLTGCAQFGYGDSDECKVISFGPNASAKYPTAYFRKTVQVPDPTQFANLSLRLLRDDGGVVYVNGTEAYRSPTMPQPPAVILFSTYATNQSVSTAPPDNTVDQATLNRNLLVAGANVLAVEIHQHRGDSSDMSFDLELTGNLGPRPPRLNAARFGNDMVLYWADASYQVEASDELGANAHWTLLGGTSSPATIAPGDAQKFYRLKK